VIHNNLLQFIRAAGAVTAVLNIVSKWLIGVLIQKLILLSSGTMELTTAASPLFEFIFLNDVSFQVVATLSRVVSALLSVSSSASASLSLLRGAQTGRRPRNEILSRGDSSANSEASPDQNANELIIKVKMVERFQSSDESRIVVKSITLALTFVLTFSDCCHRYAQQVVLPSCTAFKQAFVSPSNKPACRSTPDCRL
jgi:hypothetical protein